MNKLLVMTSLLGGLACQVAMAAEVAAPQEPWLVELNRSHAANPDKSMAAAAQGKRVIDPYKNAQVGAHVAGYLDHDTILLDSPEMVTYLQSIATKLLAPWQGPVPEIKFLIRSTAEPCAYSDVQQTILVCSGFLQSLENEDQLAALLAHEISHVLLGHAQDAATRKVLPVGMEVVGTITAAVKQRQAGPATERLTPKAAQALETTQLATTLWSDMLAPSWNRDQEREADRLGLDLMRAAGYNEGAFAAVLTQLDNVRHSRSDRMEAIKQTVVIKSAPKGTAKNTLAEAGQQLQEQATQAFINNLFDGVNNYAQDYDAPSERLRLLQEYNALVYAKKRRDKSVKADKFVATLRNGMGGNVLKSDAKAIAIRTALNSGDLNGALTTAQNSEGPALSLSLAKAEAFIKSRRYDKATPLLTTATQSTYAPGFAYRDLALAYRAQRKFPESLTALQLGGTRLGRETVFLPDLVETSRGANEMDAAEQYAIRCNTEQQIETLKNPLSLLSASLKPQAQQPATGLYAECIQRLGYDPVKKRQGQNKSAPDVSKALKGLLGGK